MKKNEEEKICLAHKNSNNLNFDKFREEKLNPAIDGHFFFYLLFFSESFVRILIIYHIQNWYITSMYICIRVNEENVRSQIKNCIPANLTKYCGFPYFMGISVRSNNNNNKNQPSLISAAKKLKYSCCFNCVWVPEIRLMYLHCVLFLFIKFFFFAIISSHFSHISVWESNLSHWFVFVIKLQICGNKLVIEFWW